MCGLGRVPYAGGVLTAGAYTRLPLSLRNKDLHYLGKLWNIRSTAYAAIYIYIIYGTLRWSFKNETTHLGWMNSMKQFGILSRNPGAVRTSRRITAETFQRCSMSCRFEKLCRYRTIIRYGLINWKIPKKLKMVDELRVFWPGNVWNLHDLWQALLTNHGYAQTISCPGHVGRTSPWRASCPRQSWNLRRKPHSVRITLVASRSMFRGIVHIPVDNWPLLKRESSWYLFRNLPCEPPKLHDKNEYSILQCLDRWACRIEGIMEM